MENYKREEKNEDENQYETKIEVLKSYLPQDTQVLT